MSNTDARGVTATFSYDALNRLTAIQYPNAAENVTFVYDEGVNGVGRMTTMIDESGSYQMRYDARGNVIEETRIIGSITIVTGYAYDAADRLIRISYPRGLNIRYARDALGRIISVTAELGTLTRTVIEQREFAPFGPAVGWRFGNGLELDRTLDQDYRLTSQQTLPVQSLDFSYDPAGNILGIQDGADPARSQGFTYDVADRLATASASGDYGTRAYGYDVLGNRLSRTADGEPEDTYAYAPDSNRLTSITGPNAGTFAYDAAGNTITKDELGISYNDANRLSAVTLSGQPLASYLYNARGERVK